jgi:hypothetical protein
MKTLESKAELLKAKFENHQAIGYVLNQLETENSNFTPKEKEYLTKAYNLLKRISQNTYNLVTCQGVSREGIEEIRSIFEKINPWENAEDKQEFESQLLFFSKEINFFSNYINELITSPETFYSQKNKEKRDSLLQAFKLIESVYKPKIREHLASLLIT